MRAVHVHRVHSGLLAIRASALQVFRVRQGRLRRGLRLHVDGAVRGQILRHRRSNEKASRHRYDLRFPISSSLRSPESLRLRARPCELRRGCSLVALKKRTWFQSSVGEYVYRSFWLKFRN